VAVNVESDAPAKPEENDASLALKAQIDRLNHSEQLVRQQQQAANAARAANERRMSWLETTPGAKENAQALGPIHYEALDSGLIDTSPEYFAYLEQRLADLPKPAAAAATRVTDDMQRLAAQDRATQPPPRQRSYASIVSAPVSREVPSTGSGRRQNSSRVVLTPQEQEMARISGVSLETYAREKLRLAQMRADGTYGDQERGQ
jgi:hypothetical protein